jgi:aminoglycoside 2'-N-acetyltransferase I
LPHVDVVVLESGNSMRRPGRALRELWHRAFGDRIDDDDADHAFGGVHDPTSVR